MAKWLLKSEPNVWSISDQKKVGLKGATWDGVRNFQASNNLKKMKKGDFCFFYHLNIGKEIVGIVKVIKTAVLRISKELKNQKEKYHLAASFQETINEILYEKTKIAMEEFLKDKENIEKTFVIAGGVAANLKIRENLTKLSSEKKFTSIFPPVNLCSDNAAMIAWAGIERYKMNLIDNLEFPSKARWPLDSSAPFLKGPGLKI